MQKGRWRFQGRQTAIICLKLWIILYTHDITWSLLRLLYWRYSDASYRTFFLNDAVLYPETMEPSIQVKIIAVDFTEDTAIYQRIAAELGDLKIGVLINNVGMCDNFCEPFTEIGSERVIDDLITCNVVSVPRMIHMILPGMLQRKRGVIINIGSIAGVVSTPLGTLYGATKVSVVSTIHKLLV